MKKTLKKVFIPQNNKIKGILSGLFFAVISFTTVYAFVIKTDVKQAIQYIQQTIYTDNGGQSGSTLIHIGEGKNNIQVLPGGKVKSNEYCDSNGENCRQSEKMIYSDNIISENIIPKLGNKGRNLVPSKIIDNGKNVTINGDSYLNGKTVIGTDNLDPNQYSFKNLKLFVRGNSFVEGSITGSSLYGGNKIFSKKGYCDFDNNCREITDFYTKTESDKKYYEKTKVNELLLQYYKKQETDDKFQEDIKDTTCPLGISKVADDGTLTCVELSAINGNETDPTVNKLGKQKKLDSCGNGQIAKFDGTNRICSDVNTNFYTKEEINTALLNLKNKFYEQEVSDKRYYTTGQSDEKFLAKNDVNSLGKSTNLNCSDGQVAKFNGTDRVCSDDIDTNTNFYVDNVSFDSGNGNLTINVSGSSFFDTNLDGRYLLSGENIELKGTITVGNYSPSIKPKLGTIKFSGDHFYGFNSTGWQRLDK